MSGRTVVIGGARGGRVRVSQDDARVLIPEWSLRERSERFAASGIEVARRGGMRAHEVIGYVLRADLAIARAVARSDRGLHVLPDDADRIRAAARLLPEEEADLLWVARGVA